MSEETDYLNNYDISEYPRPSVTADVAVFTVLENKSLGILLIKRGNPPYKDHWALPGGFMEPGETVEECALRELREETGIVPASVFLAGVFSNPRRDPRGWIISNAFTCAYCLEMGDAVSGDDAKDAAWFDVSFTKAESGLYELLLKHDGFCGRSVLTESRSRSGAVMFRQIESGLLAFDHAEMIASAVCSIKSRVKEFEALFDFLPFDFTLGELQTVYESVTGVRMIPNNFRKHAYPFVVATDRYTCRNSLRPARIYNRKG